MRCTNPITIKRPGLGARARALVYGLDSKVHDNVVVPCGHCLACLKNKQNSLIVRVYREAQKMGSFHFVTLTYNDDCLPIAKSLYKVDKDTGESIRQAAFEIVCSGRSALSPRVADFERETYIEGCVFRKRLAFMKAGRSPRYLDIPLTKVNEFTGEHYFVRYTPTTCRKDVQMWLKQARVEYEREHGFKLSEFSYLLVSEMGSRSCRPHYHLGFFGLTALEVRWLANKWKYGYNYVETVNRINEDRSDGYQLAAKYLGKYMSKGVFECPSVKDGCCEKPRLCSSACLGTEVDWKMMSYYLAFDLHGPYTRDGLTRLDGVSKLTEKEISDIVAEIPRRLSYVLPGGVRMPLPRSIKTKIFARYNETKETFEPYRIWSLVSASLRNQLETQSEEDFLAYCSANSSRSLNDVVSEYAVLCASTRKAECPLDEEDFITFYSKSLF